MRCAIVHYHELALKGRNRDYFEQRLVRNIRLALSGLGITQVEHLRSRIRIVLPPDADTGRVRTGLHKSVESPTFLWPGRRRLI